MTDASVASPGETQRFELRMQLEPLDFLDFMKSVRWNWLERVIAMLPVVGIGGIGALIALTVSEPFIEKLPVFDYWDWGLAISIGGAVFAAFLYKVFIWAPYVDATFHGQPIGMGSTTIVADTQGVSSTSAGVEVRVPWANMQHVVATDRHLFLMFSRLGAVIVPRRAFADDADATSFATFVHNMVPKGA